MLRNLETLQEICQIMTITRLFESVRYRFLTHLHKYLFIRKLSVVLNSAFNDSIQLNRARLFEGTKL